VVYFFPGHSVDFSLLTFQFHSYVLLYSLLSDTTIRGIGQIKHRIIITEFILGLSEVPNALRGVNGGVMGDASPNILAGGAMPLIPVGATNLCQVNLAKTNLVPICL